MPAATRRWQNSFGGGQFFSITVYSTVMRFSLSAEGEIKVENVGVAKGKKKPALTRR
ncbi:hypothetical protein MJ560_28170 [Klebsiella pneumoniae]|nr:hypothetical protein MJ560_28170 [Klebsiella pneumoniae]